jgi:hypothetical protein
MKSYIKNRFRLTLGFVWVLTIVSCQSQNELSSDVSSIVSKSIEKIIGCDSLRFFPPLILSDGATDSENDILRAKYNKLRSDYLKIQKYLVIPDSATIDYGKKRIAEVIVINELSSKRFYDLLETSKLNQSPKSLAIIANITQINIQLSDSKDKAKVSYRLRCKLAEGGGWAGELRLYKDNKEWFVENH